MSFIPHCSATVIYICIHTHTHIYAYITYACVCVSISWQDEFLEVEFLLVKFIGQGG